MYRLDYTSKSPIYQQIVDQTKTAIAKGYFKDGDQIPSVREMAKSLLVNQSTITRAYREMETLGIIQTVTGKGTFIALDEKKMKWEREKMVEKLREIFSQCAFLGIGREEVLGLYDEIREVRK